MSAGYWVGALLGALIAVANLAAWWWAFSRVYGNSLNPPPADPTLNNGDKS